jgi:hypothetical protein
MSKRYSKKKENLSRIINVEEIESREDHLRNLEALLKDREKRAISRNLRKMMILKMILNPNPAVKVGIGKRIGEAEVRKEETRKHHPARKLSEITS